MQKRRLNILCSFLLSTFFLLLDGQNPFIENKGQLPKNIKAKVNLPSGALFIENNQHTYVFYSSEDLSKMHDNTKEDKTIAAHAYQVELLGTKKNITNHLSGKSNFFENYYIGDSSRWATGVRSYKQFKKQAIYEGIDMNFRVENDKLKYDFIVKANANPKEIKMLYKSVSNIELLNGQIYIRTSVNEVIEKKPYAYQYINGEKIIVKCNYTLKNNIVTFEFPNQYNNQHNLIIDPILEFSTYSGSTSDNFGYTATYDDFGFLYAGSTSFGVGYPTTLGAFQINYANTQGGTDIAITKYDTSGTQRIYSTYLGGNLDELPHSMIVNGLNELFIYGTTASSDFPTTPSSYQPNFKGGPAFSPSGIGVGFPNGSDIFVSRLSANGGALLASTYIGGTGNDGLNTSSVLKYNYADEVRGEIDIDDQNNIYIASCTQSSDFPVNRGVFQPFSGGNQEGCIIKMDNQLTTIIWSTYLGGSKDDGIYSLAIDTNGVYVTGGTNSGDFPTTANAFQTTFADSINADAFIVKISSNGANLIASSFYGTSSYDQSYFVEIGSKKNIYIFGQTKSTGSQLVYNSSYFVISGGQFIAIFDNELNTLIRSTVLGTGKGSPDISPTAFLVDYCDKIYLAGWGSNLGGPLSTLNLPVTANAHQSITDGNDVYLAVLDKELDSIIYSTYYGGSQSNEHVDGGTSRFDKKGVIYQSVCAGCGGNSDFPIEPMPGAVSSNNNSINCNNAVFKFNFDFPMVVANFNTPQAGCTLSYNFTNLTDSFSSTSYFWDFGDGSTSTAGNPSHTYNEGGVYSVMLVATDNTTCNISDTIIKDIYILSDTAIALTPLIKCKNEQIQIGLFPLNNPDISYLWYPQNNLSSLNVANPITNTDTTQLYQLLVSDGICTDTLSQEVLVEDLQLKTTKDTSYCNQEIELTAYFSSLASFVLWSSNRNFTDTLSTNSNLAINSPGTFYVKVANSQCEEVDSVKVFSESININVVANDICFGDSTFVEVINLNPTIPIANYNWNISNLSTPYIQDIPLSSVWYSVEATNIEGCSMKDSVYVEVHETPIIDSSWSSSPIVFQGQEVELNVETTDQIRWIDFTGADSKQIIIANATECFVFEVYNENNCILEDSICIEVEEVFCDKNKIIIPTAFSPNDDFINDNYGIKDIDGIIIKYKIEIFNRLGQRVFFSYNKNEKWDGMYKGKRLTPQVFDFYLEIECIGNKELFHKGNITLVR